MFVAPLQFVLPLQCRAGRLCVWKVWTQRASLVVGEWGVVVQFPRVMCVYIFHSMLLHNQQQSSMRAWQRLCAASCPMYRSNLALMSTLLPALTHTQPVPFPGLVG
jgi:hypothetical protein